jgi:hypothetical protein
MLQLPAHRPWTKPWISGPWRRSPLSAELGSPSSKPADSVAPLGRRGPNATALCVTRPIGFFPMTLRRSDEPLVERW